MTLPTAAPATADASPGPPLPRPRGPLSAHLVDHLRRPPGPLALPPPVPPPADVLADDDLQLALYCCYELHYRSFAGVDERWEWEPSLLALRRSLEGAVEAGLRASIGVVAPPGDVEAALASVVASASGPSLSQWVLERGTIAHLRELAAHRSAYQLKEADPHTWAVPRLSGGPKAALLEIQLDEYGRGVEAEMHSSLFAVTMGALGLDATYGAYLDRLPGVTLATTNLVSMFGLQRRWRGALVGHLALFEATSVGPMGRYAAALRRLGVGGGAERFYDVHVDADAHHEVVALRDMAGALAAREPHLAADIVFGARALMLVEGAFARHVLGRWAAGRTSLTGPLAGPPAPAAGGRR
ncbi:MAG: iron-containing redox enzyme family protein [Acidimicrobiia bacterium]